MKLADLQNKARHIAVQPRTRKIGIWIVGLFAAFGILGFLAGPPIAKAILLDKMGEALHRKVSIEDISINPYALSASVRGLSVKSADGQEQAGFDSLYVNIEASSLFRGGPVVSELKLAGPRLNVTRIDEHRYDVSDLIDEWSKPSSAPTPPFAVYNIQITDGKLQLDDRPTGKKHTVSDLKLQLPFISSLSYQTDVNVLPHFSAVINGSPLVLEGRAKPFSPTLESELSIDLDRVNLTNYLAYSPIKPPFDLKSAALDTELKLQFRLAGKEAGMLKLTGAIHLKDVAANDLDGIPLFAWKQLDVDLAGLDLLERTLKFGEIRLQGLEHGFYVDGRGRINWLEVASRIQGSDGKQEQTGKPLAISIAAIVLDDASWSWREATGSKRREAVQRLRLKHAEIKEMAVAGAEQKIAIGSFELQAPKIELIRDETGLLHLPQRQGSGSADKSAPWNLAIGKIGIADGAVRYEDRSAKDIPVQQFDDLQVGIEGLSTDPGKPAKLSVAARVNQKGGVKLGGNLQLRPLNANFDLDLSGLPILPAQPFFTDRLNITFLRGNLSGKGSLTLAEGQEGLGGSFKGKLQVGDLHTIDKINGADFLRWKTLDVDNVDARLLPLSVNIGEIALNDFYARMIVTPEGTLNLSQIVRKADETKPVSVTGAVEAGAAAKPEGRAAATLSKSEPVKPVPPVKIAKFNFRNGRVNFSDFFVKPNYTVNVTKIIGSVKGLSSEAGSLADLELHGGYDNVAPVDVVAKLNPLAAKAYLDLKGEIRSVDLTKLSTYSAKYAGYAIDKGKLSLFVTYKLENNQLNAENRVFLDQLTFGEKVDSPDATSLPVKLAVALLKNGRGEIDINLPISGSIDDPQFSLGGVIAKVIINLFVKVVTSPFALLGSIFSGGGEELSTVEFAPGHARLTPEALKKLEALAKAMNDRPALKLEITGRADPQTDREGGKRAAIDRAMRLEKQKDAVKKGIEADPLNQIEISAKEYPEYLARVYKEAKFDKPRNLIGMQKSIPVEEMEKLLLANTEVSEEDLRQLALRRAQNVQAWLTGEGKVPVERIFLLPAKLSAETKEGDKASPNRVEFSLR